MKVQQLLKTDEVVWNDQRSSSDENDIELIMMHTSVDALRESDEKAPVQLQMGSRMF